ncbi:MAG: glycosyltransferase [Bacillaceae bacterium]|nr:glycosyltransferase [Bacillaceae bacterium]
MWVELLLKKDVEIAIDTFLSLPQHLRNESHLLIVGDGPLQRSLSSKKEKQITWTGFVEGENLAKIYASSDLFLFPSPTETFGNVVLEALSSGLPVIAANAGGVKHLVEHNHSGYLCEPKKYL